jgi:serine/threonine protein kinase/tetratricopeptide (TPR) repeat protein
MQDNQNAVLDCERPTDVIHGLHGEFATDSSQNPSWHETTAFQEVQIRRLEDLGSWAESVLENPEQVRLVQEVHRSNPRFAHRLAQAAVAMPEVGTDFVGFRLVKEIGKGAFARVFLATQGELADRLVVLKVSPSYDDESGTLAQLQHTNVVPLYSVHRAEPLQAVCMPFFGLTTLAHVLKDIKGQSSLPESGKSLVSTLVARNSTARIVHEVRQSDIQESVREAEKDEARQAIVSTSILDKLQSLSYVDAVLWMGARLADGLAHAHERGILHRDLKPANILITDEGQPMLLDFNLAHDTKVRSRASVALLGGTLPYMSPEQLEAYRDETVAENCNSDVYSLGIILFELLAGRHPFESRYGPFEEVIGQMAADRQKLPMGLRTTNRAISPAVESVIRRCLEPNPQRRYQSARELQEDLQCQLAHQPLKHAPNPSTLERFQKWTRRHPRLASTTSVGILSILVVLGMVSLMIARNHRLAHLESEANYREFVGDTKNAEFLLTPFTSEPEKLHRGLAAAQQAIARYEVLENASWRERPVVRLLPPDKQEKLDENLGELFFLLARAHLMQAVTKSNLTERQGEARAALQWHSAAKNSLRTDAAPSALAFQRAEIENLLNANQTTKASEIRPLEAPRTAFDQYLLATEYHARGQIYKALDLFEKATRKNPTSFWSWFMRGVCHDNLAQYEAAASCYSTSIALQPEFPWTYYNRGLAELRLQRNEEARADFSQSIERQPENPDAYLQRAVAHQRLQQNQEAIRDLTEALKLGAPSTLVYSLRSPLRQKTGDTAGAKSDFEECLKTQPTSDRAWIARGFARMMADPAGALADTEEALKLNPRSLAGLQNKAHLLGRMGKTQEAIRALDQAVDLYPDFIPARAGRGVYYARLSQRDLAHHDAEVSLRQDKSASNVYQLAGIYALTSRTTPEDRREALRLLSLALSKDVGLVDLISGDKDLDPIRQDAKFLQLVDKARSLRASLQEHSQKTP